jgi:L-glyceraldehyde 3-phosphate reductase
MTSASPPPSRYDGRMPYRKSGSSGLKLPLLSLGCWHNFGGDSATPSQREMIRCAFDGGITHFDLANNYGPPYGSAERNVGEILHDLPRDEIIVSSKAGYDMWPGPYGSGGSRKHLLASLDQSLSRAGLDYFDIFYSHCFDPEVPLEETLGALDSAVRQGKALYVGISSYSTSQTSEVLGLCRKLGLSIPVLHQPNYSMLNRWVEQELLSFCTEEGLGVIAFCPLFQGLLSNKYLNGIPVSSRFNQPLSPLRKNEVNEQNLRVVRELNDLALSRGQTLAQLALAWVLRRENVTSALMGASTTEQIKENLEAVKNIEFTNEELAKIDRIVAKINLPKSLWATD